MARVTLAIIAEDNEELYDCVNALDHTDTKALRDALLKTAGIQGRLIGLMIEDDEIYESVRGRDDEPKR